MITMKSDHGTERVQSCLPDKCDIICSLADSAVMDTLQRIADGTITLKEMEAIYEKKHQVEKLYAASQGSNLGEFKMLLECRNKECCAFKLHKIILDSFCSEMEQAELHIDG